jgi:hypothetical protein
MKGAPRSIGFHAHPPERGRRPSVTLYGGCCSCCCCCCLHTLGGIIGSAVAPAVGGEAPPRLSLDHEAFDLPAPVPRVPGDPSAVTSGRAGVTTGAGGAARPRPSYDEDVFDLRNPSRLSAVALFWYVSLALAGLGGLYGLSRGLAGIIVGVVILALVFPGLQLVSALVVLLALAFSDRPDRAYQLRQLGKIAIGLVLGTLAGLAFMALLAFGLSKAR